MPGTSATIRAFEIRLTGMQQYGLRRTCQKYSGGCAKRERFAGALGYAEDDQAIGTAINLLHDGLSGLPSHSQKRSQWGPILLCEIGHLPQYGFLSAAQSTRQTQVSVPYLSQWDLRYVKRGYGTVTGLCKR